MMFREAWISMRKSKGFTALIVLQCTLCFFVVNLSVVNLQGMRSASSHYSTHFSEQNRFELSDQLSDTSLGSIIINENDLLRQKSFYNDLVNSTGYRFLETIKQPIFIRDYRGPDLFRYGYEDGSPWPNSLIDGSEYAAIKAVKINENVWKTYDLQVAEGRNLRPSDYIFIPTIVPAVLGHEYRSLYELGDRIQIHYYFMPMTMEVVGFFAQDTAILRKGGELTYLDRYIVLPSLNHPHPPVDDEEFRLQRILYLEKVNGSILLEEGYRLADFASVLENLRRRHDMYEFAVWGVSGHELRWLKIAVDESKGFMMLISGLMVVFSIVSLSIILTTKMKKNRHEYGIHLMCGGTTRQVMSYVIAECLLFYGIAHFLAFTVTAVFFGRAMTYSLLWVALSLAGVAIVCIQPLTYLSRLDISTLVRRKEG